MKKKIIGVVLAAALLAGGVVFAIQVQSRDVVPEVPPCCVDDGDDLARERFTLPRKDDKPVEPTKPPKG